MTSVAEALAQASADQAQREARAERLRERQAKSFYNSFAWRKVRYAFLRSQPKPLRCGACGRSVADGAVLCVDHLKSVKKYPQLKTSLSNLQILCRDCNLGKGSQFADDWRAGEGEQIERHSADAQSPHGRFLTKL
jgi:5-methylcytosine-specific restriction endonuclease McrA